MGRCGLYWTCKTLMDRFGSGFTSTNVLKLKKKKKLNNQKGDLFSILSFFCKTFRIKYELALKKKKKRTCKIFFYGEIIGQLILSPSKKLQPIICYLVIHCISSCKIFSLFIAFQPHILSTQKKFTYVEDILTIYVRRKNSVAEIWLVLKYFEDNSQNTYRLKS